MQSQRNPNQINFVCTLLPNEVDATNGLRACPSEKLQWQLEALEELMLLLSMVVVEEISKLALHHDAPKAHFLEWGRIYACGML